MRVVHIVADGRPGGGTTVTLGLAQQQMERYECEVYFVSQCDSYAVHEVECTDVFGVDFSRGRFSIPVVRELAKILIRVKPDVVHVHGARAGLPVTFLPRLLRQIPFIYTVHGYHFLDKSFGLRQLAAIAEWWISRCAATTVFISSENEKTATTWKLVRRDGKSLIRNGIDIDALPKPTSSDLNLIGFLGRMSHPKNPMMALKVIERLRDDGYRLIMIGGGEMEQQVKEGIASRGLGDFVEFVGELPRTEALERASNIGVLLMPSLWEGLPIAPLEAMGMRIPVVGSEVVGLTDVISSGINGFLVKQQNEDLYADAILKATRDMDLRQSIVEKAEIRLRSEFTQSVMVDHYMSLYQRILGGDLRAV